MLRVEINGPIYDAKVQAKGYGSWSCIFHNSADTTSLLKTCKKKRSKRALQQPLHMSESN
ncbi:hypothetical protein A7985_25075 [Pseudoalteromonas luteoviolacea]|uniref:Uncharacterized protein n=1 Tax=Pseudoalteromonas luteoviolacea TaxID=43657 RepID=A0A1C0TIT3_9GAMM|nr:hypothetical protein A7985_25075 [Pseudoalteromonas luteoviolacea]